MKLKMTIAIFISAILLAAPAFGAAQDDEKTLPAAATKEIAAGLNVSIKTVDTHRQRIMRKLDIHNAVELTKYAIREGIIVL